MGGNAHTLAQYFLKRKIKYMYLNQHLLKWLLSFVRDYFKLSKILYENQVVSFLFTYSTTWL